MKFGQRRGDAVEPENDGLFLRNFKKGETTVRFLQEPDDWTLYYEHFIQNGQTRQAFPCTQDTLSCPGCQSEVESIRRRSRKYATYVWIKSFNAVSAYKVAVSLANRLTTRAERNGGTLLNRDYVIIRTGDGMETEYDVDQDEKYSVDTERLLKEAESKNSIETILADMYHKAWDGKDEDQPANVTSLDNKRESKKNEEQPPWEQPKAEPEQEQEVTEAELRKMSRAQLETLWQQAEWDGWDDDWSKSEALEAILAKASD